MPYLYCAKHGQQHAANAIEQQELYREEGEAVLIFKAPLKSGAWVCDRCNVPLRKGDIAYLVTAFSQDFADELATYRFEYERRYFVMEKAEARVYGAVPSGGLPDEAMTEEESL